MIAVRLIFLKHSLNHDTLLLKNQGFPVLMELSGLAFDQVYKILPTIVLKTITPFLLNGVPRLPELQPTVSSVCSSFTFLPCCLPTHLSRPTWGDVFFIGPFLIVRGRHGNCSLPLCYRMYPILIVRGYFIHPSRW